jgi:hypothetical protein
MTFSVRVDRSSKLENEPQCIASQLRAFTHFGFPNEATTRSKLEPRSWRMNLTFIRRRHRTKRARPAAPVPPMSSPNLEILGIPNHLLQVQHARFIPGNLTGCRSLNAHSSADVYRSCCSSRASGFKNRLAARWTSAHGSETSVL